MHSPNVVHRLARSCESCLVSYIWRTRLCACVSFWLACLRVSRVRIIAARATSQRVWHASYNWYTFFAIYQRNFCYMCRSVDRFLRGQSIFRSFGGLWCVLCASVRSEVRMWKVTPSLSGDRATSPLHRCARATATVCAERCRAACACHSVLPSSRIVYDDGGQFTDQPRRRWVNPKARGSTLV